MKSPRFKVGDVIICTSADPYKGRVRKIHKVTGEDYHSEALYESGEVHPIIIRQIDNEYELLPLYNSPLYLAMSEEE